ncbi:glycosidase [Terriglobus roseus DSM 18391]|uniref:Glycosidase n=1 Tax=Terriglobus roseus (strain DSM 18391 / NRRL B-41598 / KBS 63) TaxID=926566 RepID=I3ZE70_TERRK|nr:alpha-amylase family glycosyl hydrolase [Terriglobus roseus]AFL87538.1 glycosidase [Terriglobus roseus DSM 18391]
MFARPVVASCLSLIFASALSLHAQAPRITKVDPPNWWVNMPAPMLLINGEHLNGAKFSVGGLPIERTTISDNGHWAELWLAKDATSVGDLRITAQTTQGKAEVPFRFEPRRAANDGFAGFSSRDVMYLIMTDRFADGDKTNDGPDAKDSADSAAAQAQRKEGRGWHGGDLRGIEQHLDYLQALGINTVWITPVYQNHDHDSYHGYGATDMYAVDEHYGSLEDLKSLSKALHARGMKLVLDTVPNHVGPMHPWVNDEPEPTWFHGTKVKHTVAQMDFQPLTNSHAPWSTQRDVTEGWFVDTLPDNNQSNPANAKYLVQNAIWWTEQAGLDGLRIDTFPYVQRDFWTQFNSTLRTLYPKLTSVGEVSGTDPIINSSFAGGVTRDGVDTGLWTPLDYPLHFAIRNAFTGASPMTELVTILRQDSLYPHPERLVPFLDNHDLIRFASEPNATLAGGKLAMTFLLTVRGMPQLYAGNEIYMDGYQDPDNRHDFPGGFANASNDVFQASTRQPVQKEMFDWTSGLLALRSKTPALQTGTLQILYASTDSLVYTRTEGKQRVLIAIHRGSEDVTLHLPTLDTSITGANAATRLYGEGELTFGSGDVAVALPANSALIAEIQ